MHRLSPKSRLRQLSVNVQLTNQRSNAFVYSSKSAFHSSKKNSNEAVQLVKDFISKSPYLRSLAPKGFGKYYPKEAGGGAAKPKGEPTPGSSSSKGTNSTNKQTKSTVDETAKGKRRS